MWIQLVACSNKAIQTKKPDRLNYRVFLLKVFLLAQQCNLSVIGFLSVESVLYIYYPYIFPLFAGSAFVVHTAIPRIVHLGGLIDQTACLWFEYAHFEIDVQDLQCLWNKKVVDAIVIRRESVRGK